MHSGSRHTEGRKGKLRKQDGGTGREKIRERGAFTKHRNEGHKHTHIKQVLQVEKIRESQRNVSQGKVKAIAPALEVRGGGGTRKAKTRAVRGREWRCSSPPSKKAGPTKVTSRTKGEGKRGPVGGGPANKGKGQIRFIAAGGGVSD